jgi:hypothetical protein
MTDFPELQQLLVGAAARRIRRRRPRHAARLALALAVVALVVLALTHLPSASRDREVPAGTPTPIAPRTDAIEKAYGVFRRPARPQDDPGKRRPPFTGKARLIASTAKSDVFLILGKRDMCLLTHAKRGSTGGGGCGPRGAYVDGKRPMGTFSDDPGPSLIAFAFPDGVEEVTLILADGSSATYPVRDNGFARDVPDRPVRLEWTAPDGEVAHTDFMAAPPFAAEDFYPELKRPETPQDALDGLPGARLIEQSGDARAWLVPRLGSVCLVVRIGGAEASGCRHKVADVRRPLIVALERPNGPHALAIAFPHGASRISLDGRAQQGSSILLTGITNGDHTLRYRSPARHPMTDRLPGGGSFTLHARPEPPTAIPQP